MRILVATDAWRPQISGVVRTLEALATAVHASGSTLDFLTPDGFASLPLPTYPGLRVALPNRAEIARRIKAAEPEAIESGRPALPVQALPSTDAGRRP